ncbi:MAG: outer membrane protein assembly factor BamE [Puniceicoccaceae bacterium]|nr:outer membrane protein assembly factor BamE [Puniceicoccaceae bacterium]
MKKYTSYLSVLTIHCCVLLSAPSALTAEGISREEFVALAQRVEQLEASLRIVKNTQVEAIATEAFASMPMNQADKNSLIDNVVSTIQAREEIANYPWMDTEKWSKITKGMSPEEVVAVLDEPTLNEPSMHKRVDIVYTYEGRRVATAKKVTGIVRFYKGKAIEIEVPEL